MRERAALVEGRLDLVSKRGAGTTVHLMLPTGGAGERSAAKVRVLLVEDHAAVREAIAAMFAREPDIELVAQAGSLAEARPLLGAIDVAVIDLGLPDGHGSDLIAELRAVNPRAHALVLSASLDASETARAIERGAAGALDKTAHLGEVVSAVRRLQAGDQLLPAEETLEWLRLAGREREQERKRRAAFALLTPRELEVLQHLANGLDSMEIAERLHITIRTERNHIANILRKLGVHSRLQALLLAVRFGVVTFR